jgi:hypothetical protein
MANTTAAMKGNFVIIATDAVPHRHDFASFYNNLGHSCPTPPFVQLEASVSADVHNDFAARVPRQVEI